MKIRWTHEALERLREIDRFISRDSPTRASQFIRQIIEQAGPLAQNPRLGRIVPEISNPEIRELIFKNYRIVYRIFPESIDILTVFEGHMILKRPESDD